MLKLLILFIALSYVYTSPINVPLESIEKAISSDKISSTDLPKSEIVANTNVQPIDSSIQSVPQAPSVNGEVIRSLEDKKLNRVVRNNKVEYVYLNSDGEIVQPKQNLLNKSKLVFFFDLILLIFVDVNYSLSFITE